jgi:predicted AlkP superfamily pyrophosphatase or phosphodiesterase
MTQHSRKRLAVINVVGLTADLLGRGLPRLNALSQRGCLRTIQPALPAVTCTAQSDYLTGLRPSQHGIVANGWYHRELAESHFWKQPNQTVRAPKVWERLRPAIKGFTCAKLFWWYNMYASVDYSITPRPMYPADGRKVFDIYTAPRDIGPAIQADLGVFPFPTFWGPVAGVTSPQGPPEAVSDWIARAARWVEARHHPDLHLIYLPHLDYNLQRLGPRAPAIDQDLARVDQIVGDLVADLSHSGVESLILSEYGITEVSKALHLNRALREKGWLSIKEELGKELIDFGASRAFAICDHQVAHVYVNDPTILNQVRALIESIDGVRMIWGDEEKRQHGLDHERSGELVVFSHDWAWFTYYYWLEDARAPDFARCVDIHRKPGYDPVELFMDPQLRFPRLKVAWRLLQKKIGLRMLMDVIPLDASLVRGSHGTLPDDPAHYPILLSSDPVFDGAQDQIASTDIASLIEGFFLS